MNLTEGATQVAQFCSDSGAGDNVMLAVYLFCGIVGVGALASLVWHLPLLARGPRVIG